MQFTSNKCQVKSQFSNQSKDLHVSKQVSQFDTTFREGKNN